VSPPSIDVFTLFHNTPGLVDPFLDCVSRLRSPVTLHLLDNGSTDRTGDAIARRIGDLVVPVRFHRSVRNHGFAGGMNLLAGQSNAPYVLVLNSDAFPRPDCVDLLLARARQDPRIGICEARQAPEEHPKAVDDPTGETTWCSGAAALIRREAFDAVGGFDARLFFMYCEDIDLSWKMWLTGWKCVYVKNAVVEHRRKPLRSPDPGNRGRLRGENYFSFRNSLFVYHRFRGRSQSRLPWSFLQKRFLSRRYSLRSKALFAIAFIDHSRYIPYLRRTRRTWGDRAHPWIRLNETSLAE
jgi:GT2 family glycosyltransferase